MNTIIDPIKRAEFWKNRLVSHASNDATRARLGLPKIGEPAR